MVCLLILLKVSITFSLQILDLFIALPGGLNGKTENILLVQLYVDQADIHLVWLIPFEFKKWILLTTARNFSYIFVTTVVYGMTSIQNCETNESRSLSCGYEAFYLLSPEFFVRKMGK